MERKLNLSYRYGECEELTIKEKQELIYENYGLEEQLNKLEEECLELALAIKHKNRSCISERNLIEEIADVKNLIEQIYICNPRLQKEIKESIEYKVDRQLERIRRS